MISHPPLRCGRCVHSHHGGRGRPRQGANERACMRRHGACAWLGPYTRFVVLTRSIPTAIHRRQRRRSCLCGIDHREVPKHEIGNNHLLVQRAPWIRQFEMRQAVKRTLRLYRVPIVHRVVHRHGRRGGRAEKLARSISIRVMKAFSFAENVGEERILFTPGRRTAFIGRPFFFLVSRLIVVFR